MAAPVTLHWQIPPSVLGKNIGDYADRVLRAVFDLSTFFAAKIEAYAKANAPWTDRTGNARQGLTARAFKTATAVTIVLFGTASYQIWLEVANAGRFAIILKTLEAHYGPYMRAIEGLLR
jgi:hypothetical protein